MADISCPRCGSTQIIANKKGFSGKKAVAGAVLTGGVGLLAGTIGSNKIKITCLACGKEFYPGEGDIKNEDDENVSSGEQSPSEVEQFIIKKIKETGMLGAVKAYNEFSDIGLEKSKEKVDEVYSRFNLKNEDIKKPTGCAGIILLAVSIGALLHYLL